MTWGGVPPSGQFATFNSGGGVGSADYEPANGDVSGLIDNLQVVGIQGRPVSPLSPSIGDAYIWNGLFWIPTPASSGTPSGVAPHNILSAVHLDSVPASPSDGSLIAGSGSPASWVKFPIGLPHQSLRVDESNKLDWRYDPIQIIISGSVVNLTQDDHRVVVNKTVGSATLFNLPPLPYLGQEILIKDGKGDANMNKITVLPPSGLTLDGLNSFVIKQKYQSMHFMYNGSDWNII
jgi:hypothetical protein